MRVLDPVGLFEYACLESYAVFTLLSVSQSEGHKCTNYHIDSFSCCLKGLGLTLPKKTVFQKEYFKWLIIHLQKKPKGGPIGKNPSLLRQNGFALSAAFGALTLVRQASLMHLQAEARPGVSPGSGRFSQPPVELLREFRAKEVLCSVKTRIR